MTPADNARDLRSRAAWRMSAGAQTRVYRRIWYGTLFGYQIVDCGTVAQYTRLQARGMLSGYCLRALAARFPAFTP